MFDEDTLSRYYVEGVDDEFHPDVEWMGFVECTFAYFSIDIQNYKGKRLKAKRYNTYNKQFSQAGRKWERNFIQLHFREISCNDGHLIKGMKLIIPKQISQRILDIIYEPHLCIAKSKSRAWDVSLGWKCLHKLRIIEMFYLFYYTKEQSIRKNGLHWLNRSIIG